MHTEKVAKMGLILALGMILSYVEVLIPIAPTMPGVKIGLSNALVLLLLYSYGVGYAVIYQVTRIVLTAILFGNVFSAVYSLAGATLSLAVMLLIKRCQWLDIPGVSMLGGVFHNVGQLIVAYFFVRNVAVAWYLPVLLVAGAISGYLIGLLSELILKRRLL